MSYCKRFQCLTKRSVTTVAAVTILHMPDNDDQLGLESYDTIILEKVADKAELSVNLYKS